MTPDRPLGAPQAAPARALDRSFLVVFLVVSSVSIVPLWISKILPMVDLPQHLSIIQIWNEVDEPPFAQFFTERGLLSPYVGYYWVVSQLAALFPLEVANRLFLSASAVGLPLATLALLRALGRSPWLSLFAVPLAYEFSFSYGFINFSAGVVTCVATWALYVAWFRQRLRGWPWEVLLLLAPVACALTHAMTYLVMGALLVASIAGLRLSPLPTLLRVAPSAIVFGSWLVPSLGSPADREAMAGKLKAEPFVEHFEKLFAHLFAWFRGDAGVWVALGYFTLLALAVALAVRTSKPQDPLPLTRTLMLIALSAWAAYALLPWDFQRVRIVYPRFAALACLFTAVCIPLRPTAAGRALGGALAVGCLAWSLTLIGVFRRVDEEVGDLHSLANLMEPRSCVAGVDRYFESAVLEGSASHSHHAEYLAFLTHSIPGYTFAFTPQSPLALRRADGSRAQSREDAALPLLDGARLTKDRTERIYSFYRYFLAPRKMGPTELFGRRREEIRAIGSTATYVLYENPRGTCGA